MSITFSVIKSPDSFTLPAAEVEMDLSAVELMCITNQLV